MDVSSSTWTTLTGVPAASFSNDQQRWAKSIRYMVAHMQTIGEREVDLLLGMILFEPVDQMEFGADGPLGSCRSRFDCLENGACGADLVGMSTTSCMHSGGP